MQRTYSRWLRPGRRSLLGLGLAGATAAAATLNLAPSSAASSPFGSRPLDGSRFAVLAKPVGNSEWMLLVLEQIQPAPRCWEQRSDGLIDPALNRFDFTGICSRYLDSNGYSLRIGEEDLASRYRLRLAQRGNALALLAMTPSDPTELLVGRGSVPLRDRDGFVQIQLEPGWQLQRRVYGQQTLSHVYFANATPLAQLLGAAGSGDMAGAPQPLARPPRTLTPLQPLTSPSDARGPIALQVVPFQP
ncbi:MAG: DUF3747 domain-containing protein [Vulcanococcus sp.]